MSGNYYEEVKSLTLDALSHIEHELRGNYQGYDGTNAVSMYLNNEHDINVTCDSTAHDAFCDALQSNRDCEY